MSPQMEADQPEESSATPPSLNLNGVSMQLPLTSPHILAPHRIKQPAKRSPRRHLRPSTAPAEETAVLLPSIPSGVSIIESRPSGPVTARDAGCMSLNGKNTEGAVAQERSDCQSPPVNKRDEKHSPDLGKSQSIIHAESLTH
jgi:hypothetical protein